MQLNYPKESNYQICLQPFFPFKVAHKYGVFLATN